MAVNYQAALKTTRMTAVRDAIDAGAGAGVLEIGTTGFASTLAQLTLIDPCGSVSGSVLTLTAAGVQDASANNTGTAAEGRIKDSNGNIIVDGLTVGTTGTNIIIASTTITAGQVVTMSSGTLTHG